MEKERQELEKLDINKAPGSGGTPPRIPSEFRKDHHDDSDEMPYLKNDDGGDK